MTELSKTVSLERRGDIALLWTDNPPVNAIGQSVKVGLHKGLAEIARDPAINAGVVICRGSSFFSGADITEFGQAEQPPSWIDFDRRLDLSDKPIVAAIHTRAFGGGLELALACHYRVADRAVVFAFPEVGLGIIPGGGGTQRFLRVAGFEAALDIIPSARVFSTEEAIKLGVIDRSVEGKLEEAAIAFAQEIIAKGVKGADLPRARNRNEAIETARANPQIFTKARETVKKRFRGFNGRLRAIDAIEKALSLSFDAGRYSEQNMIAMAKYGLPPMISPKRKIASQEWKTPYGNGTVTGDEAWTHVVRFWDEVNGFKGAGGNYMDLFKNLDDTDRRMYQAGLLGFQPRNWEAAQSRQSTFF